MPKMTIRVILKSGSEFAIKCDKFTIQQNGFGQVAAVVRVYSDEKEAGGGE